MRAYLLPTEIEDSLRGMDPGTHAVLVYDTPEHKRDVLMGHLLEGQGKEGLVYAYADEHPRAIKAEMKKRGIEVDHLLATGDLRVTSSEEVYLKGSRMDVDGIIAGFSDLAWRYRKRGMKGIRAGADMSPIMKAGRVQELIAYERRLGTHFEFPGKGVCAYNLVELYGTKRLDSLMDIFMAHGLVVMAGPKGYAVRNPDTLKRGGISGVLHHVMPAAKPATVPSSGFHPVASR